MSKKRDAGKGEFQTDCYGNIRWVEGDEVAGYQDAVRDTFLAAVRVGVARSRLNLHELEAIGVSVKSGLVSVEQGMADLHQLGLLEGLFPDGRDGKGGA